MRVSVAPALGIGADFNVASFMDVKCLCLIALICISSLLTELISWETILFTVRVRFDVHVNIKNIS